MLCAQPNADRAKLLERTRLYLPENRFVLSTEESGKTTTILCDSHKYQKEPEPVGLGITCRFAVQILEHNSKGVER